MEQIIEYCGKITKNPLFNKYTAITLTIDEMIYIELLDRLAHNNDIDLI